MNAPAPQTLPPAALETRAREQIARAINHLVLKEAFFGHLFAQAVRLGTNRISTMAVGAIQGRITLLYNPDFALSLAFDRDVNAKNTLCGVLKHEALHLCFKHIFRHRGEGIDNRIHNLAADLVVNQYVQPWGLPDGCVLLSTFPDLNLAPHESLPYYYAALRKLQTPEGAAAAPQAAKALETMLGRGGESLDSHEGWGAEGGEAQIAEGNLDRQLEQAKARTSAENWGNVPGAIQHLVDAAIARRRPQVDWRRVIRLFAASSRKTRIANTVRRRSKRYGTHPGLCVKRYQRLAVVVDTSGSVDDAALSAFFSEIHGIHRQGAEVTVIECDARVQRTYPYRGATPTAVAGRGGTAFDPALQWLRQQRIPYDACIYLTDGYACRPATAANCPLLWVLTPGGTGEYVKGLGRTVTLPGDST